MIKTIVFDLGGVYFKNGTKVALPEICKLVNVPKGIVSELFGPDARKEGFLYRKGMLTREQFWEAAAKKLRTDEETLSRIRRIWHSSYTPIGGMKELVSALRKNYRVIAFSGSIKERVDYLNEKYGLREEFDGFIFSFQSGLHKKEPAFFEVLAKNVECKPDECVFIDDIKDYLDTARGFGFKTILFTSPSKLKSDLRKLGVKV
jgi:HAD superfamily hydrolase (TIGR01509 family)